MALRHRTGLIEKRVFVNDAAQSPGIFREASVAYGPIWLAVGGKGGWLIAGRIRGSISRGSRSRAPDSVLSQERQAADSSYLQAKVVQSIRVLAPIDRVSLT
jgi:hypothetical protein